MTSLFGDELSGGTALPQR